MTLRWPAWMYDRLEETAEREQRQMSDVIRRIMARAINEGFADDFEATPLTEQRPRNEG